jgi:cytidylate kinase
VLDWNGDPADAETATRAAQMLIASDLARGDLRSPEADRAASQVAALPPVRAALLDFQRRFGAGGAVLDGRDIGTVIFPQAPVKLFVIASPEARARRRWQELQARGTEASYDAVLADVLARDALDRARTAAPLRPAEDAVILDTTKLDPDAAYAAALAIARQRAQWYGGSWPRP